MSNIFFTSDLHLGHDREFIFKPRGFENVHDMNEAIVKNWNSVVGTEDEIYLLGDVMLGDNEVGTKLLHSLKGKIHIIRGNHDTNPRMACYKESHNVVDVNEGQYLKVGKQNLYLCHFPTYTSNLEKSANLGEHIINLFGHTHQQTNFFNEIPFMYHVGVDSHNNTPVAYEDIIADIKKKADECYKFL